MSNMTRLSIPMTPAAIIAAQFLRSITAGRRERRSLRGFRALACFGKRRAAGRVQLRRELLARFARTVGTFVRTNVDAAFASDSTDDLTPLRASRASAFARFIDDPIRWLTKLIARDSTTVPSLMSERNIAAASRSAHSRVTAAAPSVASHRWRGAAIIAAGVIGMLKRVMFDMQISP